jgi:hypothetical protein
LPEEGETVSVSLASISVVEPQSVLLCFGNAFSKQKLVGHKYPLYADSAFIQGYGLDGGPNESQNITGNAVAGNGNYNNLSVAITRTKISFYQGAFLVSSWDNPTLPLLVGVDLNGARTCILPVTLTAHNHKASPY